MRGGGERDALAHPWSECRRVHGFKPGVRALWKNAYRRRFRRAERAEAQDQDSGDPPGPMVHSVEALEADIAQLRAIDACGAMDDCEAGRCPCAALAGWSR